MKRRHRSKEELIRQALEFKRRKDTCYTAPFTGMAIICNYTLWKTEGFTQNKLAKYNQIVDTYYQGINGGSTDVKDLADRLYEKAEFKIEFAEYTEDDILVSKKDKYAYSLNRQNIEINNTINKSCCEYLNVCFNALMDMGYGNMRLNRVRAAVTEQLNNSGGKVMDLHQELIDGVGIYIEKPIVRQVK